MIVYRLSYKVHMKNLDKVYAVVIGNAVHYYSNKEIRDRVFDRLSSAGSQVTTVDYAPGTLSLEKSGEIDNVRFGNPALMRGQKPGKFGL